MLTMSYDTESKSRNASCVPFRGRGPRSGEGMDGGKNDYDILILCLIALKGKRLTTFCASLALLHPLLSLTHWIFRSLMLPYKSSSHSAKCVRYAPRGATITLSGRAAVAPPERSDATLLHNLRRQPRPFFIKPAAPAATTILGPKARQT